MENRKKQEIFTKLVNLTDGNIFGRRRIPMFGKKEKYINTKTARKKNLENWTKSDSIRTAHTKRRNVTYPLLF